MKNTKQTRYILSNGLAFAEQREMDKLSRLSEKGWHLERFSRFGFGFIVRKGAAHKQIYCLDIQQVSQEEENEYRELFAAGGWDLVCSAGEMHIFAAEPGTRPIHSDRTTLFEKYRKITRSSKIFTLVVMLLTLLTITLMYLSGQVWDHSLLYNISRVSMIVCAMFFLPSLMVYAAFSLRLRALSS
ncbi:DUF2812 domain-containing protein [Paenibacillus sp. MMS20-IR301]|uniref:DUF2812 domain-containing protein n=1 Tax=Paenibacillus sp. MMS20-IR301 TaxID=2895946 RepID=UPI0028E9AC5A|nr:DUF2812 domain-containing protein [Paenibacillus sp. MMS20-IR301]WNS44556.1 DUF2812 domain-containing protein [Paenibacillus sp. MMS20-IR301]